MALTEEQKEIAFRHLETKAVKGCAFCGQKKFELKNLVVGVEVGVVVRKNQ